MQEIAKYYNRLAEKHGYSYKTSDGGSWDNLNARYKVLSEVCDLTGKEVLEIGCGHGALGGYLDKKYKLKSYTGIDIADKTIEVGKKQYPHLDLRVADICKFDPKKSYDVVVAEGIFYRLPKSVKGYDRVTELIMHMFRLSKEAIAFSAVCTHPYGSSDNELRIEIGSTFRLLSNFTKFITVRADYHLGDVTFYCYKNKQ